MSNCPFCDCDPFHRTDSGEAVAVVCCDMGALLHRGARPAPEEVTLAWDDFLAMGAKLGEQRRMIDRLQEIEEVARELIGPDGMRLTISDTQRLTVVEKADKSDPHYRLCSLLA